MTSFRKAVRTAVKVRIALAGPSGGGKSYTALTWAHALGKKIAAVDTEFGSLSTYVGVNGWDFDVVEPDSFDPTKLAQLAREAATAGYDVLVVDSLSHYWNGAGGMIDLSEKLQSGSNKFSGWSKANERERTMIQALLSFPGHVIVTLRTKNERVVEEDERGRKKVVDVVLKPIQRDGIEYEFGVVGEMDLSNTLTIKKSRIAAVPVGSVYEQPGPEIVREISDYLSAGEMLPSPQEFADHALTEGLTRPELQVIGEQVRRAGYDGAGVVDANGETVGLRDLVIGLWNGASA